MAHNNLKEQLTERGLARRVKRAFNNVSLTFAAITVPGLESIAKSELEGLSSGCVTTVSNGIIEFTGTLELLYRAHLECRTISRILMRITSFTARSYPELYNKLTRVHWELYTGFHKTIRITASSTTSRVHHTAHIAETVLGAVNDRLNSLSLSVCEDAKAVTGFHVRLNNDECTVSIDASGALLYKRGIRTITHHAPLRETTAAALLMAVGWSRFPVVVDPFCGSGSIICEAALMAVSAAPGLQRDFAFTAWPSFNAGVWTRFRDNEQSRIAVSHAPRFHAGDIDPDAVEIVRKNCSALPAVPQHLSIDCRDAFTMYPEQEFGSSGLIISNLPYGKRITPGTTDMDAFFRRLGVWLKSECRGWNYAFLVADLQFEHKAGLKARTLLTFSNGGIRVRLVTGTMQPRQSERSG